MTEISVSCISEAWPRVLQEVLLHGVETAVIADGVPRKTIELWTPIIVNLDKPLTEMEPTGSKWTGVKLQQYARQLVYGENGDGFDYTYWQRLRRYSTDDELRFYTDQIDNIMRNLMKEPSSRKEIAVTYIPEIDSYHLKTGLAIPCLSLVDFKLRSGQLNLTCYFRSNDACSAWPINAYGLAKLLEHVADQLGVEAGRLSMISNAMHIYNEDLESARQIAGIVP